MWLAATASAVVVLPEPGTEKLAEFPARDCMGRTAALVIPQFAGVAPAESTESLLEFGLGDGNLACLPFSGGGRRSFEAAPPFEGEFNVAGDQVVAVRSPAALVDVVVDSENELCHWLITSRDPPPVGRHVSAEDCAEESSGSPVVQYGWTLEQKVSAVET